jgi:signal recognition particle subunit SRP54
LFTTPPPSGTRPDTRLYERRESAVRSYARAMPRQFNRAEGVIDIAATNAPEVLDSALTRPWRFDTKVDVALPVVKAFIDAVKPRALGAEVQKSLTPGQVFVKVLHEELVRVMGPEGGRLELRAQAPVVILLAGLQGAGKTTTAAKLARWLKESLKKRVALASTDVYRPAAVTQLERLAAQVEAGFIPTDLAARPVDIATHALAEAKRGVYDVLIIDTAGRLHVDGEMMSEVQAIDAAVGAHQRLFVVDSMAGQDAVNAARAFNEALDLTGVILTKADGDARGGAALSVRHVTGKPILFVGMGEKV